MYARSVCPALAFPVIEQCLYGFAGGAARPNENSTPAAVRRVRSKEHIRSVRTCMQTLAQVQYAKDAVPGMLVGVFIMYVVGGFWRSEMSKLYEQMRGQRTFAQLLTDGGGGGGASSAAAGGARRKPLR